MTARGRRLRAIHRRMSFAAFDRLPRQLGWKYEYVDGSARIYPARVFIPYEIKLAVPTADNHPTIRAVAPADREGLRLGFADAFRTAPEYANHSNSRYADEVTRYFHRYFNALRGEPSPASRLAVAERETIGAALVVWTGTAPLLDCLFVRPKFAHGGWATALATHAAAALFQTGATRLRSYAMQANEPSIRWHQRFGFRELPDLYVARHRFKFYRDEWDRRVRRDDLPEDELAKIREAMDYWYRESDRLEEDRFQEYLKTHAAAELTR